MKQRPLGHPFLWFFVSLILMGGAFLFDQDKKAKERVRQDEVASKIREEKKKLEAELVRSTPSPEDMKKMFAQIYDSDAEIRWKSASLLIKKESHATGENILYTILTQDPTHRNRALALEKLTSGKGKISNVVVKGAGAALRDSHPTVRNAAIAALMRVGDETHIPALKMPLSDTNIGLRRLTLKAIMKIIKRTGKNTLTHEMVDLIRAYVYDSNAKIRWDSILLLIEIRDPGSEKLIYFSLDQDPSSGVRMKALELIVDMDKKNAIPFLFETLQNSNMKIKLRAFQLIGAKGGGEDLNQLNRHMQFGPRKTRLAALDAANKIEARAMEKRKMARKALEKKVRKLEEAERKLNK